MSTDALKHNSRHCVPESLRSKMFRLAAKSRTSIFRTITRNAITNFCRSLSSSPSPWLMLPPSAEEESGRTYNFYSLAHNKVLSFNHNKTKRSSKILHHPDINESEFVGSSHGWVSLFNPRNTDMFLFNPLTGRHIKLPPMDTIYTPPDEYTRAWVHKLIITCPPESQDCRAVMLYDENRLAYCSPGSSTRWMGPIDPHYTPRVGDWGDFGTYEDFVYDRKYNLLLCIGDHFEAWRITSTDDRLFNPKNLIFQNSNLLYEYYRQETQGYLCSKDGYYIYQRKHLVVHCRQYFLVLRDFVYMDPPDRVPMPDDDYPCKTVGFHVHKIETDGLLGESEGSLGGLAMFIGRNHSFALPAADYPGLLPNSVYFTQHWASIPPRTPVYSAYGGHDIGVFDYETKTISPCYYTCDDQSFKRIMPAPMWFTPSPDPGI